MKTVYLAGLISTEKTESLTWRYDAASAFEGKMRVLSPMRGKDKLGSTSKDGGITTSELTANDILMRDYHDVKESHVILAHLETFGSTRPMVGTIAELAWAWMLQIPVVAICNKDNYLMRNHPFVKAFVSHFSETVEEGVTFVATYYGE
jgi:nucleoside 2-deoxyribosyltransferase